jgi:hypothetical protein
MPSKVEIDVVTDVRKAVDNLAEVDRKVGTLTDSLTTLKGRAGLALKDMAIDTGIQLGQKVAGDIFQATLDFQTLEFTITEAFGEGGPIRSDLAEWADEWNELLGTSTLRTEELTAAIGLQVQQMGFGKEESLELAQQIVEAGAAMSLYREDVDSAKDATDLITAALRGEKDALFNLIGELEFTGDAATDLDLIIGALSEDFAFLSSDASENKRNMNELKATYQEIVDVLAEGLQPILKALPLAIGALKTAFDRDAIPILSHMNAIKRVADAIKTAFDAIKSAVESVIDAINRIPTPSLPSLPNIPNPFDGFSNPLDVLPFGASGAVVTKPTLSLIGEAGPEALVPLNQMPGASPLSSLGGGVVNVIVELDSRVLARGVARGSDLLGGVPIKIRAAG